LFAGIPLTDPELSHSFTVVSAHNPSRLNWATLAAVDTLVILMGGKHLPEIVRHLQHQGQPPQHPVAIVQWAGWDRQQIWVGTLADIVNQTTGVLLSPAVIVVGRVVNLRSVFSDEGSALPAWSMASPSQSLWSSAMMSELSPKQPMLSSLPLMGKTVLITQSASQSGSFSDRLHSLGARVLEMPALEIRPPSSWAPLDGALADLDRYDWVILTSANGVAGFMDRLGHHGRDARALHTLKIAVVGRKTASSLQQYGLQPDFIPPDFVADTLADQFPDKDNLAGTTILFPRVETGGREILVTQLTAKGATVVEVPAYQSQCPAAMDPKIVDALCHQAIDVITFASSKTVTHFCHLFQQALASEAHGPQSQDWQLYLQAICLASIGPQTSETCRQLLGRVDLEAREYTLEGLAQGLVDYFANLVPCS
jgi:uroporphyrinogen III methyltransferase/synthase